VHGLQPALFIIRPICALSAAIVCIQFSGHYDTICQANVNPVQKRPHQQPFAKWVGRWAGKAADAAILFALSNEKSLRKALTMNAPDKSENMYVGQVHSPRHRSTIEEDSYMGSLIDCQTLV